MYVIHIINITNTNMYGNRWDLTAAWGPLQASWNWDRRFSCTRLNWNPPTMLDSANCRIRLAKKQSKQRCECYTKVKPNAWLQVYRRAVKRGFCFNLMLAGESGLGKASLINSMFLADVCQKKVLIISFPCQSLVYILKHPNESLKRPFLMSIFCLVCLWFWK